MGVLTTIMGRNKFRLKYKISYNMMDRHRNSGLHLKVPEMSVNGGSWCPFSLESGIVYGGSS